MLGKHSSTKEWDDARRATAPRPPEVRHFFPREPMGHMQSAVPASTLQRPSERPQLHPSTAAVWSIGAAASARKKRRLQTLRDGPHTGVSEPSPGSLGVGLAGGRRLICSVGVVCSEGRGLFGVKGRLVMMPPFCSQAPRRPRGSLVCAHGAGVRGVERRWG